MSDKRNATIKDVADRSGVSIATVSYALNGSRSVGAEAKERVLAAASDLGYIPNRIATGLLRRRTHVIGVAAQSYKWGDFWQLLSSMDDVAQEQGYKMLLAAQPDEPGRPSAVVRDFLSRRVDAIVSLATTANDRTEMISAAMQSGIPFAMAYHDSQEARGLADSVSPDHRQGAYLATRHLLSLGRRRIAYIGGPRERLASILRLEGYKQALAESGVGFEESLAMFGPFTVEAGRVAATVVLGGLAPAPDAIFAASDPIAAGALRACRAVGARVPGDIAVVGFNNDLDLCEACDPPLTSIAMPLVETGAVCMARLLGRLADPAQWHPQTMRLPCRLIVRQTA